MHLFYLLTYTTSLALIFPLFFPFWHDILYFTPFIVYCFYRSSLIGCLWWSLISGFIVDLFSADTRLGNDALNYCLATFFLYPYRFHFFEDRLSTLPTLTFCLTCLSALIQVAIFYAISRPFALSWHWLFTDFLFVPLQTSLYAIFAFTIPSLLITYYKRRYLLFQISRKRR